MNSQGFVILFIPLLGLVPICRGGRFHWRVLSSTLLNGVFWFGWITSLVVGLLVLLRP
jgi:hypothetical protein